MVSDSCSNSCLGDCTCEDCATDCSAPAVNIYCVEGTCSAECDIDDDCLNKECDDKDGCDDYGTFKDYHDRENTCNNGCTCTDKVCDVYTEIITDNDGDGYDTECDNDCDDNPAACGAGCNPGITEETCDGYDNNCNGQTDEGCSDLEVTLLELYYPPSPTVNKWVVLKARIKNNGAIPSSDFGWQVKTGNTVSQTTDDSAWLGAGQTKTIYPMFKHPTAGTFDVKLIVDYDTNVFESNEGNNEGVIPVTIS